MKNPEIETGAFSPPFYPILGISFGIWAMITALLGYKFVKLNLISFSTTDAEAAQSMLLLLFLVGAATAAVHGIVIAYYTVNQTVSPSGDEHEDHRRRVS